MKIAFLISAHTDASQLRRLVEALPEGSDFYIHIDRKARLGDFTSVLPRTSRVRYIAHRVNVVWGSLNEVQYQMELLREALAAPVRYDRLITLSGMDYPLWSNDRILRFLEEQEGRELICGMCMSNQQRGGDLYKRYRFLASQPWPNGSVPSKLRVLCRKAVAAVGVRKPLVFPDDQGHLHHLYKGAAWWAITPKLARLILDKWDTDRALRRYFSTSFGPAETFAQTVAFNSPLADRCLLVEGEFQNLPALTPLTYIYYKPGFVRMLTEEDYPLIVAEDKMFCRKVVSGRSDALVRLIEAARTAASPALTLG